MDLVIIQVYMPTTAHDDTVVEGVYEELKKLIDNAGKGERQTGGSCNNTSLHANNSS